MFLSTLILQKHRFWDKYSLPEEPTMVGKLKSVHLPEVNGIFERGLG